MKILVTGAAGFIGMHVSQLLLARGDTVVGLDNLNDYYDPQLKRDRLARLAPHANFRFVQLDVGVARTAPLDGRNSLGWCLAPYAGGSHPPVIVTSTVPGSSPNCCVHPTAL